MRQVLTVGEVAGSLRCSSRHVRRLFGQGDFEGFRLGSDIRIFTDSVEAYVKENANTANVKPAAPWAGLFRRQSA